MAGSMSLALVSDSLRVMGWFVPVRIRESKCELVVTITGNASINIGKGFELQRFGGVVFSRLSTVSVLMRVRGGGCVPFARGYGNDTGNDRLRARRWRALTEQR